MAHTTIKHAVAAAHCMGLKAAAEAATHHHQTGHGNSILLEGCCRSSNTTIKHTVAAAYCRGLKAAAAAAATPQSNTP
jgi:hypothetical protein